jgi:hypothetical protein
MIFTPTAFDRFSCACRFKLPSDALISFTSF